MALTTAQLLADQAYLFGDFPSETLTFPVGGTSYACLVPRAENRNDWEMGGLDDNRRVTVLIDRNLLATAPQQGDTIGFRGVTWRVVSARHDFVQAPLMIEMEFDDSRFVPSDILLAGGGGTLLTGAGEPLLKSNP